MAAEIFVSNARASRRASMTPVIYSSEEDAGKRRRPSLVIDGQSIVDIIRKKRDGEELCDNEIDWFVSSATKRQITDAQIGTGQRC